MAKLRLRLVRCLGDLPNGTRYWTGRLFRPYTMISSSVRQNKVWVHMGHEYNHRAKRFEGFYFVPVWIEVKND